MAKILVADDNSNIQKMVGLALKDQGIDVVAVGNGEAAVRKISDVRPDLVLADVFMPVRNGYEVCKYVKEDSSLAHIPVILLVGAFDPLDEQEAQRVGADGVLKKPFVPPEPLVSMVKSALARAGVLNSEKQAEPPPIQAADMIAPRVQEIPAIAAVPAYGGSGIEESEESKRRLPEPVRIDGSAPPAFGSLLETPVVKEEDEDPGYMPSAHPELTVERDWRSTDETEEISEEEEPTASWRSGNEAFDDVSAGAARDWRDTALEDLPTRHSAREAWEPVHEKPSRVEAAEDDVVVATKESVPTPIPVNKTAPAPFAGDAWAATIAAGSNEEKTAEHAGVASEEEPVVEAAYATESAPVVEGTAKSEPVSSAAPVAEEKPQQEVVAAEPAKSSMAESWFSPAPSPWDAEIKKAGELTAGWDGASTRSNPSVATPEVASFTSAEAVAHEAGLPSAAVEAIREEAAIVTETAASSKAEPVAQATMSEANMDDLVAKVLARMSPEVLQAVTREILKPVVEAMVRDELNSKKS